MSLCFKIGFKASHLLCAWIYKLDICGDEQRHLAGNASSRKVVCFTYNISVILHQVTHVNSVFEAFQSYRRQQLFHTSGSDPQRSPSYAPGKVDVKVTAASSKYIQGDFFNWDPPKNHKFFFR